MKSRGSRGSGLLIAVLLSTISSARGQVEWLSLPRCPMGGGGIKGCYDPTRDRVVVYRGDTWEFDGLSWSVRTPLQIPSIGGVARAGVDIAYDEQGQHCVMLATFSETWTYDGITWTRVSTTGPSPQYMTRLAWNGSRGRVMALGGTNSWYADLWEWDGIAWSLVQTNNGPPTAGNLTQYITFAHDPIRDVMVVCGGVQPNNGRPIAVPGTWEWDAQSG